MSEATPPPTPVNPTASSVLDPLLTALKAAVEAATQGPAAKIAVVTGLDAATGGILVRFEGEEIPSERPLMPLPGAYPVPIVGDRVQLLASGSTWVVLGPIGGGAPAVPIGSVTAYAGASAPPGWLLCDGSTVSRDTYPALFAAIGTTYGAGDGSSTFGLPNLADRVPVGSGSRSRGATGGAATVTLTSAQIPGHTHSQPSHTHSFSDTSTHTHSFSGSDAHTHSVPTSGSTAINEGTSGGTTNVASTADGTSGSTTVSISGTTGSGTVTVSGTTGSGGGDTTGSTGGGGSHENMPPFVVMPWIIRAA